MVSERASQRAFFGVTALLFAASARAAAVISESISIAPHLSLPPSDARCLVYLTTTHQHVVSRIERTTKGAKNDDQTHDRDT